MTGGDSWHVNTNWCRLHRRLPLSPFYDMAGPQSHPYSSSPSRRAHTQVCPLALRRASPPPHPPRNRLHRLVGEPCVDAWHGVVCCPESHPDYLSDGRCSSGGGAPFSLSQPADVYPDGCHSGSHTGTEADLARCVVVKLDLSNNNLRGALSKNLLTLRARSISFYVVRTIVTIVTTVTTRTPHSDSASSTDDLTRRAQRDPPQPAKSRSSDPRQQLDHRRDTARHVRAAEPRASADRVQRVRVPLDGGDRCAVVPLSPPAQRHRLRRTATSLVPCLRQQVPRSHGRARAVHSLLQRSLFGDCSFDAPRHLQVNQARRRPRRCPLSPGSPSPHSGIMICRDVFFGSYPLIITWPHISLTPRHSHQSAVTAYRILSRWPGSLSSSGWP